MDRAVALDLDNTLVYVTNEYKQAPHTISIGLLTLGLWTRPFVREFLTEIAQHYECVLFTASSKFYADEILKHVPLADEILKRRLYKEDCTLTPKGGTGKDLTKIGWPTREVYLVDDLKCNGHLQPTQLLSIPSFIGQEGDDNLLKIKNILLQRL